MPRYISPNVKTLLARDDMIAFYMVKIHNNLQSLYHTTLPYNIHVPALGTFLSDSGLQMVDPPRQSSVVDRETYKVTYVDPAFAYREMFQDGMVGHPVSVYIGFINTTDSILGDALPGQPLVGLDDILTIYEGIVDSHGHSTTEDSEVIVVFECSSPMASLNMSKPFITSQDAMRQINPTDTAFDQVYVGSREINVLWGKA